MINVVAAYLKKDGLFLITQRAHGELKGSWEFPGGKVEQAESLTEAIIREIKEELDLDIIPLKSIGTFTHKYPHASIKLTLLHCELSNSNQEIKFDGSHTEHKWININEESLYDFAPLDKKIIKRLLSMKI